MLLIMMLVLLMTMRIPCSRDENMFIICLVQHCIMYVRLPKLHDVVKADTGQENCFNCLCLLLHCCQKGTVESVVEIKCDIR